MEQLCTSCMYPENDCNSCSVIENYLTLIPNDCAFLQELKSDTSLRQLILELKDEIHTLAQEIEELKAAVPK